MFSQTSGLHPAENSQAARMTSQTNRMVVCRWMAAYHCCWRQGRHWAAVNCIEALWILGVTGDEGFHMSMPLVLQPRTQ
jgi:hypothetical protein